MGEMGRTAVVAGIGLAAMAGVAGWLMTEADKVDSGRTEAVEAAEAKTWEAPSAGDPVASAFARLGDTRIFDTGLTYGALMDAERHCMTGVLGHEPGAVAWAAHERARLFVAALRHGVDPVWSPDGTERFGQIVSAIGYDPASAFEAGVIGLADIQFAEAYMTKYVNDDRAPIYQGLDMAAAGPDLGAMRLAAGDVTPCLSAEVQRSHGIDLAADTGTGRRAAIQ